MHLNRDLIRGVVLCLLAAAPALAQTTGQPHAGMDHSATAPVSAKALKELASVAQAVLPLGAPGAAEAAGFRPLFGWIPTMGVHWVDGPRMLRGKEIDLLAPSQLMFTRIDGKDSLVGAAYAYFAPVSDTARPATFDGAPAWHEHANLAPPGQTLVMLHVWFVPSPDGPFAGTNPNLPFWAVGLVAPDPSRMRDAAFSSRVRRAGLALAEVADTNAIFSPLGRRGGMRPMLAPRRDSVRALIPELLAAQKAKDAARWDRAADKAAVQWDAMHDAYLATARSENGRMRLEQYFAMLLGEHAH